MRQRGFTLIELLVVLVIIGFTLGLVMANMAPSGRQAMQQEAQRVALLLQLARDEAIVRNRPIAFEAGTQGYRFLVREGREWKTLPQDDMLRERAFKRTPMTLLLDPPTNLPGAPLRIVFGREPVDKPFVLTLAHDDVRTAVRADGIGHFTVE
ncbi:type II secretion system minor pseudopilin GspH [Pseudoduganella albidiflava]|uniref:Type II secretion system protein H n=1 Tax=Pseudoduganella albidiflava TaxID=321983 RepID=A0A411X521_9BURK|nr:type II secretion system minor pseudopilin GspH [Pseudoduganella albidiflava]QBI04116.1 type II secretion system protein GspH [Pseudoduganella albidiflava]GGY24813.1 type II secretion system protein GspH [Pseudoduganella albidiflava]